METESQSHSHSHTASNSNSYSASFSDHELAITFKPNHHMEPPKMNNITHSNNSKSRLSEDSCTEIEDEIDDEFLSSEEVEDDLIDDLDLSVDIATNIKKLKKHHCLTPNKRPKLRPRSYSASNLNKNKNKKKHQNENDEHPDEHDSDFLEDDEIYNKYISMKKKYKKQRRISKQFQEAITSIQDDNEDVLVQTEENIRSEYEKEYEMKLIRLEHQKLNNTLEIEEKMKVLIAKNEHLINANKQLQHQVAAQASTIQQQQQITVQQQTIMQRQLSGASCGGGVTPVAMMGNIASSSTMNSGSAANSGEASRRISFGSTNSLPVHNTLITNMASMEDNYSLNTPIVVGNGGNSFSYNNINTDEECNFLKYDEEQQKQKYIITDDDDDASEETEMAEILKNASSVIMKNSHSSLHRNINMEPAAKYNKPKKQNKLTPKAIIRGKRKKLQELEAKLMQKDDEVQRKIGGGMNAWDRFWQLMTPSFCSCSPPNTTAKYINE